VFRGHLTLDSAQKEAFLGFGITPEDLSEEFLRGMHERWFVSDGLDEYERRHPVESAWSRAFLEALLLQTGLLVLFSLVLDFGQMLRACCYSSLVFWVGAAIVLLRRHSNPTKGDLV
jgi:hypothetical protein